MTRHLAVVLLIMASTQLGCSSATTKPDGGAEVASAAGDSEPSNPPTEPVAPNEVGAADPDEGGEAGPDGGRGRGRGPVDFGQMDADGDGMITREEAPERMQQFFDRIDTNADGKLDPDEIAAMRERMQAGGPGGGRGGPGGGRGGAGGGGGGPEGGGGGNVGSRLAEIGATGFAEAQGPMVRVEFREASATDESVGKLHEILPGLFMLALSSPGLTDAAIDHLSRFVNLEMVRVEGAHFSGAVVEKLKAVPRLRIVELSGVNLQPADLAPLKDMPNLQVVVIEDVALTDEWVEMFRPLADLRTVQLIGTGLSPEATAQLEKLLPDTVVEVK